MKKQIALFVLAALSPLGFAQAADKADLILYNGKVVTVDKRLLDQVGRRGEGWQDPRGGWG